MKIMNESDRRIYREELAPFLPRRIFDAHVHVYDKSFFPPGFAFEPLSVYNKFDGEFPLALWRELMRELLPEQEVWLNCFAAPDLHLDRDRVPEVNRQTEFAMVVVSPADPPALSFAGCSCRRRCGEPCPPPEPRPASAWRCHRWR